MNDIVRDPRALAAVAAHPHPLAFATVSGAHLYGFASPDSDVDIRGAHVLPIDRVIGLDPGPDTMEVSAVRDGLEVDLVTHDLRKFITLLLKRNGYVLEQLCSPLVLHETPVFEELRALAPGCITRNHGHHYLGFARTQWDLLGKDRPWRIKPLLYVYRVLLTGAHLMRTGEVVADLEHLATAAGLSDVLELIERKRTGTEGGRLDDERDVAHHARRYADLLADLEAAREGSTLPERPSVRADLDALLIRARLGGEGAAA